MDKISITSNYARFLYYKLPCLRVIVHVRTQTPGSGKGGGMWRFGWLTDGGTVNANNQLINCKPVNLPIVFFS